MYNVYFVFSSFSVDYVVSAHLYCFYPYFPALMILVLVLMVLISVAVWSQCSRLRGVVSLRVFTCHNYCSARLTGLTKSSSYLGTVSTTSRSSISTTSTVLSTSLSGLVPFCGDDEIYVRL